MHTKVANAYVHLRLPSLGSFQVLLHFIIHQIPHFVLFMRCVLRAVLWVFDIEGGNEVVSNAVTIHLRCRMCFFTLKKKSPQLLHALSPSLTQRQMCNVGKFVGESFIFTFIDHDGAISHAGLIAPEVNRNCGVPGCPVLVPYSTVLYCAYSTTCASHEGTCVRSHNTALVSLQDLWPTLSNTKLHTCSHPRCSALLALLFFDFLSH
jgi:hypothetical protein